MNKEKNNILTKKDFEEMLCKTMEEQAQSIIEAMNFGFETAKEDRDEIKKRLSSLERRVIYIEDVVTKHSKILAKHSKILAEHSKILAKHSKILDEHSKELKEIKEELKEPKFQKEPLLRRVALLEKKVSQLEVGAA